MTIAAKILIALAMLIAGFGLGYDFENAKWDAKYKDHLDADAKAEAVAQLAMRAREYQLSVAANLIAESYEKGKKDAEADSQKTVADLLDGSLRLQNRWAGCEADRMSDASASASKLDAAKRERAQSAGRIIAAASACDAQVAGLQKILNSERTQ